MSQFAYNFIQQLSMREKAYFTRYARLSGDKTDKNYLLLYEALGKMNAYQIDELKEKFADHPIGKSLASELNYLISQLLKSLVNFHIDRSSESRLQKSILYINLLIEKGFRKQALKMLKKAKKYAYKHELFTFSLQLIQLQEEILFKQGILGFTKNLENLAIERQQLNEQITNLNQLRLLREQIRDFWVSKKHIAEDDKHKHPSLFNNPMLTAQDQALSMRALEHWLYIKSGQNYLLSNFKNFQFYEKKKMELLESNAYLFNKEVFIVALANHLYSCAFMKDQRAFDETISKLYQFESDKTVNQIFTSFVINSRSLDFYYHIDKNIFRQKLVEKTERFLNQHIKQLQSTQIDYIYLLLSRAYLTNQSFHKALNLLNKWQQNSIIKVFLPHARLFSLIVYYELDLKKLIESEVETTYKLLKRHEKYNSLVKILLSFFRLYLRSPKDPIRQYSKIQTQLNSIDRTCEIITIDEDFNYTSWLNKKIEDILKAN